MNQNLTLKERIELFKLNKKPRKQIIVRFDTLAMDLNLPTLGESTNLPSNHFRINQKKTSISKGNS